MTNIFPISDHQVILQFRGDGVPGEGGDDVAAGFVHRVVHLARALTSQLGHLGELGEIESEVMNIGHGNGHRLHLRYEKLLMSLDLT